MAGSSDLIAPLPGSAAGLLLALFVVVLGPGANAPEGPVGNPAGLAAALVPECYRVVEAGPWSPRPQDAVTPFLSVPAALTLEDEVGVEGPETGRLLVRPRQVVGSRVSWAYRAPSSGEFDLQITFANEVAVVRLNLYERSWGWIGDAVAHTGAGATHRRRVRLEDLSCDAAHGAPRP